MKAELIRLGGMVILLNSALALASENPVREFDPSFELAYFEPTDASLQGSLGLKYELAYSIKLNDPLSESTSMPGLIPSRMNYWNVNVYSKGNVPFKENFPIADFIETGFDMGINSIQLKDLDQCSDNECSNSVKDDSFVGKLSAIYQFETDRGFDNKQHAYGGKFRIVYKKSEDSRLQYFNPLEWGPSAIKALIGDGVDISGGRKLIAPKPFAEAYLPSLAVAVEQVDPEEDDIRASIDPTLKSFARVRADLSYSSTLFKLSNDQVYRASFTYRYFHELSPEKAIEAANLDSFNYRTFAIHTPNNIVISYSKGRLPFDAGSEAMFKVGWENNF